MIKVNFIEPIFDKLAKKLFGKGDKEGIIKDITDVRDKQKEIYGAINDFFNNEFKNAIGASEVFFDMFNDISGGKMTEDKSESESSSGISASEKSLTEETANILASYINAIRADVSVKRALQEKFFNVDFPKLSVIAQAQLSQLGVIASNTERNAQFAEDIYNLLRRNTLPGTGFKIA